MTPNSREQSETISSASGTYLLLRLRVEISEFARPPLKLSDELTRMSVASHVETPEAVVLYAGRILEGLARDALLCIQQRPNAHVFSNLQLLQQLNRLDIATQYWAHSLRRLGNAMRHLLAPVTLADASLATVLVERWLEWYFCRFSHGMRLNSLTYDGHPLAIAGTSPLLRIVEELERQSASNSVEPVGDPLSILEEANFFTSPVLPAVLLETLISRGDMASACSVLERAHLHFPDDLRLDQLAGLYHSRCGNLDEALTQLQAVHRRAPDDEETAGILAGIYKRKWQTNSDDIASLQAAHRGYKSGWKRSGQQNAYLGINTAATALFLGRFNESELLARQTIQLLTSRTDLLFSDIKRSEYAFWDQLILAEATLLGGDRKRADILYDKVGRDFPQRCQDFEVAIRQRNEILAARMHPGLGGRQESDEEGE